MKQNKKIDNFQWLMAILGIVFWVLSLASILFDLFSKNITLGLNIFGIGFMVFVLMEGKIYG